MGGMHGFGEVERDEKVFHENWEADVFGMYVCLAALGYFTVDEHRHAIERMKPSHYLSASYYEKWLVGLEKLLVEKGHVGEEELKRATGADDTSEPQDTNFVEEAVSFVENGESTKQGECKPVFEEGEEVRVRNTHPEGHTRCPWYARGKMGWVERLYGSFLLPDAVVEGDKTAEPLYAVRFDSDELWGDDGEDCGVYLDMWESYLEPVGGGEG